MSMERGSLRRGDIGPRPGIPPSGAGSIGVLLARARKFSAATPSAPEFTLRGGSYFVAADARSEAAPTARHISLARVGVFTFVRGRFAIANEE